MVCFGLGTSVLELSRKAEKLRLRKGMSIVNTILYDLQNGSTYMFVIV